MTGRQRRKTHKKSPTNKRRGVSSSASSAREIRPPAVCFSIGVHRAPLSTYVWPLLTIILLTLPARSGKTQEVAVWGVFETAIENSTVYANPFTDVALTATFTSPNGETFEFFGFHDGDGQGGQGGNVWKLRFMPDTAGEWSYSYDWSDEAPAGSGTFDAVAANLPGAIQPDEQSPSVWRLEDRREFIPFHVAGPGFETADDPRLGEYLDYLREDLGARGVAVVLRNLVWLDCENDASCSPVNDSFSIRNWRRADHFLSELEARELGVNIMIYTDDAERPLFGGQSSKELLLFRYLMARLAPYPFITFDSGIDITEYRSSPWSSWFAQTLRDLDPWNHLVGSRHGGGSGEFSCAACSYDALGDVHPTYAAILATMTSTQKPIFYTDRWREDFRRGDFDSDSLRRIMWYCSLAGGAGFMVGGRNGSLRFEDFESDLDNPPQFKAFSEFWHARDIPWATFSPCNDRVNGGVCLGDGSGQWIVYLDAGGSVIVDLFDADELLSVEWLNPRTGDHQVGIAVAGGEAVEFTAPGAGDWVLHLSNQIADPTPPSAPTGAIAEALSDAQITLTWNEASDPESGIIRYQLHRDGTPIADVLFDELAYTDDGLEEQTTYVYEVSAINGSGIEGARGVATEATTTADVTAPALVSAVAYRQDQVIVLFSESLAQESAETAPHYSINDDVDVLAAELDSDDRTVLLTTSGLAPHVLYSLTVNGVEDRSAAGNAIAANSQIDFTLTTRVSESLVVLYTFEDGPGTTVFDVSGVDPALDLELAHAARATWLPDAVVIEGNTMIASPGPATKIIEACKATDAITIEAWMRPQNAIQDGPARIVTLSANTSERDFTLGQSLNEYDVRFRTTATDGQGLPSVTTPDGAVQNALSHIVYARDAGGRVRLFVDAIERVSTIRSGDLSNWNAGYRLALANELSLDRGWLGEIHLVAIYDRALSTSEVEQNYQVGPGSHTTFDRGDPNVDGATDISDPVFVLNYLFADADTPTCLKAADANDDGGIDISDPIFLLNHLFVNGPAPDAPFESCGNDPTSDALSCLSHPPCQ